jgi:hypothetical protein
MLAGINAEGTGPFRFENKNKYRPDEARFVHDCRQAAPGGKKALQPTVVPARFVTACTSGHLDEFPYVEYVHNAGTCPKGREGRLTMLDPGGNYGSQISIRCSCGAKRTMRDALKHHRTAGSTALPGFRARHPTWECSTPKGARRRCAQWSSGRAISGSVRNHHSCPTLSQCCGGGCTEAATGPVDQGDLVGQ